MISLDLNSDEVVKFSAKLERMSRSALPVAVRGALNNAAFDVKKNTLLKQTEKDFTIRQKNFFKANSKVEQAQGFDLRNMQASVGMVDGGLKGANNYAVKDLKQQEEGGTIKGKSFIPLLTARSGKSMSKAVRPANRISTINKIINAKNIKAKSKAQKFQLAALKAGSGGYVLGSENMGESILWRINSISKSKINKTPLYDFKKKRSVRVKGRGFLEKSSLTSAKSLEKYFIEAAEKQILKYKNK